jgi:hypothetical protein
MDRACQRRVNSINGAMAAGQLLVKTRRVNSINGAMAAGQLLVKTAAAPQVVAGEASRLCSAGINVSHLSFPPFRSPLTLQL